MSNVQPIIGDTFLYENVLKKDDMYTIIAYIGKGIYEIAIYS